MSCIPKASLPLLIYCALFFLKPLSAQQSWSITGSILTFHGDTPDRPVLVTLQFRGSPIATTFSDSEGKFFFSELSPNLYHILVEDEHYIPVDQRVEINPLIPMPVFVQLRLVPRESKSAPANSPYPVSSGQLKEISKDARREFDRASSLEKAGNKQEAVAHYQKALTYAPEYIEARNRLGSLLLSTAQFKNAQTQFEEIIRQDPNFVAAYFNLGNAYLLQKANVDAVHWVGEGLVRQPNDPFGHFLMGTAFAQLERPQMAEQELKRSLELDPSMANSHLALINLYIQQKREEAARTELLAFLRAFPHDPLAPKAKLVLDKLTPPRSN